MKNNDARQAFMNHVNADPTHKIMYYMHNALTKPGMDDYINSTVKDQFPEVHQMVNMMKDKHTSVMSTLNGTGQPASNSVALNDSGAPLVPPGYTPSKAAMPVPYSIPLSGPLNKAG